MSGWKRFLCIPTLGLSLSLALAQAPPAAATNERTFQVKGFIKELDSDGKTVRIQHEDIPNYMPAMTMPFVAKNTNELVGLRQGDSVSFRLVVTEKDGWIENITKTGAVLVMDGTSGGAVRVVRDVNALKVGYALPEYRFTNELGQAVSTSQFKGRAFAFTFFFTRCPFPTFCPFLSNNFEEAQRKLLAKPDGPTNWHLLSISFDIQYDTPETLKTYATRYKYDPAHWSFLTGDLTDITALGDQLGEYFGRDATGNFNHNLRTVVVDARGLVQAIIVGNTWTSDELVAEIVKAAKARP